MIHKGSVVCPVCEEVCFVFKRDIYGGDPVSSECVEHTDGSPMESGSEMKCDSCGVAISLHRLWQLNCNGGKDDQV